MTQHQDQAVAEGLHPVAIVFGDALRQLAERVNEPTARLELMLFADRWEIVLDGALADVAVRAVLEAGRSRLHALLDGGGA